MFDLPPVMLHVLVVLVGLLLYGVFWRATRSLPTFPKWLTRLALTAVVVLPLVFAAFVVMRGAGVDRASREVAEVERRMPSPSTGAARPSESARVEAKPAPSPEMAAPPSAQPMPPPPPVATAPPPAEPMVRPSPPTAASPPPAPKSMDDALRKQAPGAGKGVDFSLRSGGGGSGSVSGSSRDTVGRAEPGAMPAPSAKPDEGGTGGTRAEDTKWDVVPVFYGTDRARITAAARVAYSSGRAKHLEVGRALVTVPKSHEVPFVERPWIYKLPFTEVVIFREKEDPAKHFTLKEIRELTKADFLDLVRQRLATSKNYGGHALVFIHGFSVTFDNALYRTAQIAYDLKFDGAPFLYSWPSNGAISHGDYSNDRESTGQAEPYLKEFLTLVTRETGAKTVSVIAHSMGNQLLLRVLRDLKQSAPQTVSISEIILAAPDVDRDNFEFLAKEIKGLPRGMTLLAAGNDRALEISRQFWGGSPRAGEVPPGLGPLVLDGIDTIDVSAVNTEIFSLNHSGYAEKPTLLRDIEQLIKTSSRPPDARIPSLEVKSGAAGRYWSYPAQK